MITFSCYLCSNFFWASTVHPWKHHQIHSQWLKCCDSKCFGDVQKKLFKGCVEIKLRSLTLGVQYVNLCINTTPTPLFVQCTTDDRLNQCCSDKQQSSVWFWMFELNAYYLTHSLSLIRYCSFRSRLHSVSALAGLDPSDSSWNNKEAALHTLH